MGPILWISHIFLDFCYPENLRKQIQSDSYFFRLDLIFIGKNLRSIKNWTGPNPNGPLSKLRSSYSILRFFSGSVQERSDRWKKIIGFNLNTTSSIGLELRISGWIWWCWKAAKTHHLTGTLWECRLRVVLGLPGLCQCAGAGENWKKTCDKFVYLYTYTWFLHVYHYVVDTNLCLKVSDFLQKNPLLYLHPATRLSTILLSEFGKLPL